ncbi:MAG: AarF/ABC1/UbiB kinase family protein [Phycisphaerales bacterium]|nr:AarF/ABC1/UbiB kinase family protein [Phycisphaerales bacterium]MCB9862167.1 AarF/ABC1/UbiB kinase family protein [Phycisphaerales bacterium]
MAGSVIARTLGYADLALKARKLRRSSDREVSARARSLLVERMGKLRGLPQKMGQLLSMGGDEDRAAAFGKLTDHAEPLPFDEIEPVLRDAWDADIVSIVRSIETKGIAASLGQVHRATLMDGTDVAIKVQYPGIRKAAMSDLKMLGWLSAPAGDLRRGFDMQGYRNEILRDLDEELEYCIEAANQKRFAYFMQSQPAWVIPDVIESLSTDRVLVTRWIDGERIEVAAKRSLPERKALARSIIDGFFHTLFESGFIHADPHAGNYRFAHSADGPRVVLYDFGCMYQVPAEHRMAILKLIQMTMSNSGDPLKPLLALGFNPDLLEPICGKLAAVCGTIFEPFTYPGQFNVREWKRGERIADILGEDKWNFRMSGPPWLVFVMRAFHGLTYYLDRLDAPVSWSIAIRRHLDANAAALAAIDVTADENQAGAFETQARHLRIRVREGDREKVLLTFPARCVDNLAELMDDDLRERIVGHGYDLEAIGKSVRRSAYAPQSLFEINDVSTNKTACVWLE